MGEPARAAYDYQPHDSPELIWLKGNMDGQCTMGVIVSGKSYFWSLSRRQVMGLCEQGFGALKDMEPGK